MSHEKQEIEVTIEEDADTLERKADAARDRLMHTLEAIDKRRHDLTHPKAILYAHRREALIAAGALTAVVGGVTGLAIWRARSREERLRRERMHALGRFWRHPDRVAAERPRGFFRELGRRVLMGTLGFIAMHLVKRALQGSLLRDESHAALRLPRVPRETRKSLRPPDVNAFVKPS